MLQFFWGGGKAFLASCSFSLVAEALQFYKQNLDDKQKYVFLLLTSFLSNRGSLLSTKRIIIIGFETRSMKYWAKIRGVFINFWFSVFFRWLLTFTWIFCYPKLILNDIIWPNALQSAVHWLRERRGLFWTRGPLLWCWQTAFCSGLQNGIASNSIRKWQFSISTKLLIDNWSFLWKNCNQSRPSNDKQLGLMAIEPVKQSQWFHSSSCHFSLISKVRGPSGRGAQFSWIGWIGLRPALTAWVMVSSFWGHLSSSQCTHKMS